MTLQHPIWNVSIPAGNLCIAEGEYRSEDRLVRGRIHQTLPDQTPVKDSPSLEFGPYRGRARWPIARTEWQDRLNFRFAGLAEPDAVRAFDTVLDIDIWYESETRLAEASKVVGADYSGFVTSYLEVNRHSMPYQSDKVDLKLRVCIGRALPSSLYDIDEVPGQERNADAS